jgi:hypothetical protein
MAMAMARSSYFGLLPGRWARCSPRVRHVGPSAMIPCELLLIPSDLAWWCVCAAACGVALLASCKPTGSATGRTFHSTWPQELAGGGGCTELRVGGRLVPGPRTGNGWARGRLIANAPSGPCYLCVTAVLSASEDLTPGGAPPPLPRSLRGGAISVLLFCYSERLPSLVGLRLGPIAPDQARDCLRSSQWQHGPQDKPGNRRAELKKIVGKTKT